MSLFEELKRRNVVRMAVLYAIATWLILQIADVLFDQLDVPAWAFRLVLGLLVLGFPIALIFAWVFELTPEGLKREREIDRNQSITHETGRKINITIVVLLVLAIAGLVIDRLIPEQSAGTQTPISASSTSETTTAQTDPVAVAENPLSIAVLPFINMSGDPENEYFSDGLSEELLNTLVQIRELKVTGRTSSFAFKGQNLDLREVGERLNVANVLEGSVRKAANRVRITAQLVKTDDGYHLWSETFDRELDDIFAIQQEIAEQVAKALSVTLLGLKQENPGETDNSEAYQLYLRGAHIFRRSPDELESLNTARSYYEQALALDPDYVSPIYGMFRYWNRMNRNGLEDLDTNRERMSAFAATLHQIAPESVEAMLAQAGVSLVTRDWPGAIRQFREARDRFPGSVETNILYGSTIAFLDEQEEGLTAIQAGAELDPLSMEAITRLANAQSRLGYCSELKNTVERALEIQPDAGRVRGYLGFCLLIRSEGPEQAVVWLEQEPIDFIRRTGMAIALGRLGKQQEADQELASMQADYGESASYQYAQVNAQWGQSDTALDWLQKALDVNDPGVLNMLIDPLLDPIRQEPRFKELLQQAGLDGDHQPE